MTPPDDPLRAVSDLVWLTDGAMVVSEDGDESHFIGDAADRDNAHRIADAHNNDLRAALQQPARSEGLDEERLARALAKIGAEYDPSGMDLAPIVAREYAALRPLSLIPKEVPDDPAR